MLDKDGESSGKKRGRPLGFRVTEKTKDKIRKKRTGKPHSKETRDKISRSLVAYFKEKDSLTLSIEREYRNFSEEACDWLMANKEAIDETEDVISNKKLSYLNQIELCVEANSDIFSHSLTPEFILTLKQELTSLGMEEELEELVSIVG